MYHWSLEASEAGNHPVGETRQFGFEVNEDGSFNFYVRGVDWIDSKFIEGVLDGAQPGSPFSGADLLWLSFQVDINNFINSNRGISKKNDPVISRPNWEKIKDVLNVKNPISDLGCK